MKPTSEHSFPDAKVTSWRLTDTLLEVDVSDVHFDGRQHGAAKIVFPLVQPPTSMSYDPALNRWSDEKKVEPLKDICEFHHKSGRHYSLKGFGAESGRWVAIGVLSTEAQIIW